MTLTPEPVRGDDVGGTRRGVQASVMTSSRRHVLLTGLVMTLVAALLLGHVVDGAQSHDVFASSEHLRRLADSERLLVAAVRRYVADERQRLVRILRYDLPPSGARAFTDSCQYGERTRVTPMASTFPE